MIRWLVALACVAVCYTPVARADIGGSVPSPGGCDYPAVGTFGAAFGEYDYACQFPVELNGARHTTLFGGGMWMVTGTLGASFLVFNVSVSATSPAGVLRGITYWACPDFSMAEPPNPPGAWKNNITPTKCKTIGPKPELIQDMPPPPPGAPTPPLPPQPEIAPPQFPTGAPTNPTNPNPDATENK